MMTLRRLELGVALAAALSDLFSARQLAGTLDR